MAMDGETENYLIEHILRTYEQIDSNTDNEFDYKYAEASIKLAQDTLKKNFGYTDRKLREKHLMRPRMGGKRTKRNRKTKRRVKSTRRHRHKKSSTRRRHRR